MNRLRISLGLILVAVLVMLGTTTASAQAITKNASPNCSTRYGAITAKVSWDHSSPFNELQTWAYSPVKLRPTSYWAYDTFAGAHITVKPSFTQGPTKLSNGLWRYGNQHDKSNVIKVGFKFDVGPSGHVESCRLSRNLTSRWYFVEKHRNAAACKRAGERYLAGGALEKYQCRKDRDGWYDLYGLGGNWGNN